LRSDIIYTVAILLSRDTVYLHSSIPTHLLSPSISRFRYSYMTTPATTTSSSAAALFAMSWLSLVQQRWPMSMSNDEILYYPQNSKRTLLVELLQRCIHRGIQVLSPKHPTTTMVPSLMIGIHLLLASVTNTWIPYNLRAIHVQCGGPANN
jgi:hypothetical protein